MRATALKAANLENDRVQPDYSNSVLAGRIHRLVAAAFDSAILAIAITVGLLLSIAVAVPIVTIVLGVKIATLSDQGQTLGKVVTGLVIVDANSRKVVAARKSVLLRYLLPGILNMATFGVFGVVDILAMFRKDVWCPHDHMAGSVVVRK